MVLYLPDGADVLAIFYVEFCRKQNDLQGFGNVRDGNWITGISFIDNQMLGDQSRMPVSSTNNKAHNKLYLLPFFLGILGCVYQFTETEKTGSSISCCSL